MREQFRYQMAMTAAETMYSLWELEDQQEGRDLDAMMRRLKDLSAYSMTHAEILEQKEGVEMLAIAMFFGMTSNPQLQPNQRRLHQLAPATLDYQGQAEIVEQEVAARKASKPHEEESDEENSPQLRLL